MKALLWDLDDTLLNTLPGRMDALAYAYERVLGSRTDPVALWRSNRGATLEALAQRIAGGGARRFTTLYRDHYYGGERQAVPFEGIVPVLDEFLAAHIPMAVVTSKVAWGATGELAESGLLRYFQAVVGFDDTEEHKPDPEPVYTALERLCIVDPSQAVFIGDSPADIWAARNAGAVSVAALWGTLDEELLLDAMPDLRARRPNELPALLAERSGV